MNRRFQFRLRTLFVVVTVAAVILGMNELAVRKTRFENDWEVHYQDQEVWWPIAILTDTATVGLGLWFVLRNK
jgi:hypothetical protein